MPLIGWNGCVIRIRRTSWLGMGAIEGTFKQMTTLGVLLQLADHKSIEAIEPEPHIGFAGSHENARGRAQAQHRATPVRARRSAGSAWQRRNQQIRQRAACLRVQPAMERAVLCALPTSR